MKALKLTIGIMLIIAFVQCKKDIKGDLSPEIDAAIRQYEKDAACSSAKVDEYTFQAKIVYAFDPGNCGADMTTRIADEKNTTLGYLGGIAGNTKINSEEFSNAKFNRNVWKK